LENLRQRVIYCQHFACFNDPFEFWADYVGGVPDEQTEPSRFEAACNEWGYRHPDGIRDPDTAAYFDEMKDYEPSFELMLDSMRIACFGSEPDNLLMWSHYADGLRGFCVVFDEEKLLEPQPAEYILDVAYLDRPPLVDTFVYAIAWDQEDYNLMAKDETKTRVDYLGKADEAEWLEIYQQAADEALDSRRRVLTQVFASKPRAWEYEKERRLLVLTDRDDQRPLLRPYPVEAVKEIVVGERMPPEYLSSLRATVASVHGDVPFRVARRSDDQYLIALEDAT
jgi:hypothetical protein